MRRRLALVVTASAVLALGAAACGPCGHGAGRRQRDAGPDTGGAAATKKQAPDPTPPSAATGTVEGVVRLADGAELPSLPEEAPRANAAPWPASCTPPRIADRQPVRLVEGDPSRKLAGVLVSASEFQGRAEAPPRTHTVSIRDCRLDPPFLAVTRGDRIELRNDTQHPFLPSFSASGGGLMQALLHNQARTLHVDQGGVHEIACGWAAPCGRTTVAVLYHPLHQLTSDGTFRIAGIPEGDAEIHAWHPLFEDSMQRVTVRAGQTVRVELTLTAAPARPTPPPPEPPAPGAPF